MRNACLRGSLLCVMLGIMIQGCGIYTTYQTARVLPPGHFAPALECGFGAAPAVGGFPVMIGLGPSVRVGIANDIDMGVRPALLYADIKYQFLKGPQDGAFDFGVSYFPTANTGWEYPDRFQEFGLYPMVLFSTAHYFYGARVVYIRQNREGTVSNYLMPGGIVGLSVGRRLRFLPEIGLYYCAVSGPYKRLPFAFGLGLGLEYEFGKQ
ncbi:MAG: hypothetical protein NTX53_05935 [candidate division WOR-3 bacterium]|nr:hypothetical protein [candidate division WOR-3 bacterium]